MMNWKQVSWTTLCSLAVFVGSARGQATSSVRGRVTDPSGAAIPSAQIQLTRADTNLTRHAATNTEGMYEILQVPPGSYTLSATAPGFATAERMTYSDTDRLVHYEGNVKARQGTDHIEAAKVDVFLQKNACQPGRHIRRAED